MKITVELSHSDGEAVDVEAMARVLAVISKRIQPGVISGGVPVTVGEKQYYGTYVVWK